MIKVNYPISKKTRKELEDEYYKIFKDQESEFNAAKRNLPANLINFFSSITYKQIIVARIEKLVDIYDKFENTLGQNDRNVIKTHFKGIFSYDQKRISRFFEKYNDIFNLKACHYCNMDSVHVYSSLGGCFDELDFIKYAKLKELCNVHGIGESTAKKVIRLTNRENLNLASLPQPAQKVYNMIKGYDVITLGFTDEIDFATRATIRELLNVPGIGRQKANDIDRIRLNPDFLDTPEVIKLHEILSGFKGINKNHFTLDHYIPQGRCCLFARSFYNFVPSCYSCNTKLKRENMFSDDKYLHTCCPTYKKYDLTGELKFSLVQKSTVHIFGYSKKDQRKQFLENFEIDIESSNPNNRIVSVLHLRQRYSLYKDKAVKLAYLKEKYSEQSLAEIAKILSQGNKRFVTAEDIENDIFNDPLYENESFSKLHRDIKEQVGIKTR